MKITEEGEFKIKSKLYELEKMDINFLRILKSCVINLQKVKYFDLGETGEIVKTSQRFIKTFKRN